MTSVKSMNVKREQPKSHSTAIKLCERKMNLRHKDSNVEQSLRDLMLANKTADKKYFLNCPEK